MKFDESVLSNESFLAMVKDRAARIYSNQRKFLSDAVVDVADIRQEFYMAAFRVIDSDNEYDTEAHFFNAVTVAVYNYLKAEFSRGSISHTGIHTVDLRSKGTESDPKKASRGNVAVTMQLSPLSLNSPVGRDTEGGMLEEILGEDAVIDAGTSSVSDEELKALLTHCPSVYRVLTREAISPKDRRALPEKLANEILDYVEKESIPELWFEELEDLGRLLILEDARDCYALFSEQYQSQKVSGISRNEALMSIMQENRKSLAEFIGLTMMVCLTGRGTRGSYRKGTVSDIEDAEDAA